METNYGSLPVDTVERRVVGGDRQIRLVLGVEAGSEHRVAALRVGDLEDVAQRIQLTVWHALVNECGDFSSRDGRKILGELLSCFVPTSSSFRPRWTSRECDAGDVARPGHSGFERLIANVLLEKAHLVLGQPLNLLDVDLRSNQQLVS